MQPHSTIRDADFGGAADKLDGPFALQTRIVFNELRSREYGGATKDLKRPVSTFDTVPSALDS